MVGDVIFEKNAYQQAVGIFELAFQSDPLDEDVLNKLGVAYQQLGNLTKAKEFFVKALEVNPESKQTKRNLKALSR